MNPTHAIICQLAWMLISLALALFAAWVMLRREPAPSADSEYDLCRRCGSDFSVEHDSVLNQWSCPQCQTRVNMAKSAIICRECGRHLDGQPVQTAAHIRPTLCTECAIEAGRDPMPSIDPIQSL